MGFGEFFLLLFEGEEEGSRERGENLSCTVYIRRRQIDAGKDFVIEYSIQPQGTHFLETDSQYIPCAGIRLRYYSPYNLVKAQISK